MPQKKKHHYVPKFYLRNFTDDQNLFSVFRVSDRKTIDRIPYGDQCYKDYFYGTDGVWEDRLGEFETKWSLAIRKLNNLEPVEDADIKLIKQFALYQRQRTEAEVEYRKQERADVFVECVKMDFAHKGISFTTEVEAQCREHAIADVSPVDSLEFVNDLETIVSDLKLLVITYNTKNKLVSSDAPIIAINPFHKFTIGYGVMGLILCFPILSNKLVVLYDSKMYPQYRGNMYVESEDEQEVEYFNTFQLISANQILFSVNAGAFSRYTEKEWDIREANRSISPVSSMGSVDNKIIISSQRKTIFECELSFGKTCHLFNRIPFACREAAPRKWEQGWEDKLNQKEEIMMGIMNVSPENFFDIGIAKKELRRGYRRMASAAQIYWKKDVQG